jgi:hypothetical protein
VAIRAFGEPAMEVLVSNGSICNCPWVDSSGGGISEHPLVQVHRCGCAKQLGNERSLFLTLSASGELRVNASPGCRPGLTNCIFNETVPDHIDEAGYVVHVRWFRPEIAAA